MKLNDKEVLVCNCEGTMDIDGKALAKACLGGAQKTTKKNSKSGNLDVASHLCRTQLDEFQRLADASDGLLVAHACVLIEECETRNNKVPAKGECPLEERDSGVNMVWAFCACSELGAPC